MFSGQYLTYEEYRASGGDTTLLQTPFNLLEFEARRKIDIKTLNRLKNVNSKDIPQEVKICVFKLIDSMATYDTTIDEISSKGNIKSENTDGYSISYISASEIQDVVKSKSLELDDIISTCLLGVVFNGEHLMYIGV